MKIYWSSREGIDPPTNAIFFKTPFFSKYPVKIKNALRIYQLPPPTQPIQVVEKTFLPKKSNWISLIQQTLLQTHLRKVVLARCCVLKCAEAPDPFAVTAALQAKAQNATVFCFANHNTAFLGATPEHLFTRENHILHSDALAGTLPRGKTPVEDKILEQKLMSDEKLKREFAFVQNHITDALAPLSDTQPTRSALQVRKTKNVQHLYSKITVNLNFTATDFDILHRLHPTPALCGTPTNDALRWIQKTEPFSRGLYGGVLGWFTPNASDCIVAIRSCMIQGNIVYLYTAAGIIAESNPETEWEELNWKMQLYQDIFV